MGTLLAPRPAACTQGAPPGTARHRHSTGRAVRCCLSPGNVPVARPSLSLPRASPPHLLSRGLLPMSHPLGLLSRPSQPGPPPLHNLRWAISPPPPALLPPWATPSLLLFLLWATIPGGFLPRGHLSCPCLPGPPSLGHLLPQTTSAGPPPPLDHLLPRAASLLILLLPWVSSLGLHPTSSSPWTTFSSRPSPVVPSPSPSPTTHPPRGSCRFGGEVSDNLSTAPFKTPESKFYYRVGEEGSLTTYCSKRNTFNSIYSRMTLFFFGGGVGVRRVERPGDGAQIKRCR